jgi:hypothetical protein
MLPECYEREASGVDRDADSSQESAACISDDSRMTSHDSGLTPDDSRRTFLIFAVLKNTICLTNGSK